MMFPLIADASGLNQNGACRFFVRGDIERVQMVADGGTEKSLGHQVHGVRVRIDDRGSDNAFLVKTGSGTARQILATGSRGAGADIVQHAGVPELGAIVGVDVQTGIRLGDDIDDVVRALTGNAHVGNVKELGHHNIINGNTEEAAEAVLVDIARGKQSFIGVGVAGRYQRGWWEKSPARTKAQ